jgi:regulator of RNase E activity RraA
MHRRWAEYQAARQPSLEADEYTVREMAERVSSDILEMLKTVSTGTLCSQMRHRGFWNIFMHEVRPLRPELHMAGQALTLRYIPRREDLDPSGEYDNLKNKQRMAIESVESGDVLVIDARGDTRAATLGNILTARILRRGGVGIVTDGAFRDSPAIKLIDLPTYARGANANLSNSIHFPSEINVPIACGGVAVLPGDVLVGDAEGVVVIPLGLAEEVAQAASEQEQREQFIYAKIASGSSIVGVYPPNSDTLREYEAQRH